MISIMGLTAITNKLSLCAVCCLYNWAGGQPAQVEYSLLSGASLLDTASHAAHRKRSDSFERVSRQQQQDLQRFVDRDLRQKSFVANCHN